MEAVVEPAIKTKKLSKVFGNRRAVDNVSIEVPQGAFLSIFGPNGAGKTTLLRVLSTLSRATSGSWMSARAMDRRCVMPRENVRTTSRRRCFSSTASSSSRTRASGSTTP